MTKIKPNKSQSEKLVHTNSKKGRYKIYQTKISLMIQCNRKNVLR